MVQSVLVCGGAGYIGSHMVRVLLERGFQVVVLDDLSTGHREAVGAADFVEADISDAAALDAVFSAFQFDAVMHFCAKSLVGESVMEPLKYYRCNVGGTIALLEAMQRHEVQRLVFSSTAAVFGEPQTALLDETHPLRPVNPYGRSKLMVERILEDTCRSTNLCAVSLRYFNAAGAALSGGLGESHDPETHLIPNVLKAATAANPGLKIFGTDYDTRDGTCIRDYIHVEDLARAHLAAVEFLQSVDGFHAFNLGNGNGFSVLDVIRTAESVVGQPIPFETCPRRPGDPAVLVARSQLAERRLGWRAEVTDLGEIIESAWRWHRAPVFEE